MKVAERMPAFDRDLADDLDYVALFHRHLGISVKERRYKRPEDQPLAINKALWEPPAQRRPLIGNRLREASSKPRSFAAVRPSTTTRIWSRRATASMMAACVDRRPPIFNACAAILRWGGVWANVTVPYLVTRKPGSRLDELLHLSSVLAAERTPSNGDLLADPNDATSECRMNAGFVKISIFSFFTLVFLCWLVFSRPVVAPVGGWVTLWVPPCLALVFRSQGGGTRTQKTPNPQPPQRGGPRFRGLGGSSPSSRPPCGRRTWFLRGATEMDSLPFSKGGKGFDDLAAGLFMAGYDLKRDS